jgi:hypothetical protein
LTHIRGKRTQWGQQLIQRSERCEVSWWKRITIDRINDICWVPLEIKGWEGLRADFSIFGLCLFLPWSHSHILFESIRPWNEPGVPRSFFLAATQLTLRSLG